MTEVGGPFGAFGALFVTLTNPRRHFTKTLKWSGLAGSELTEGVVEHSEVQSLSSDPNTRRQPTNCCRPKASLDLLKVLPPKPYFNKAAAHFIVTQNNAPQICSSCRRRLGVRLHGGARILWPRAIHARCSQCPPHVPPWRERREDGSPPLSLHHLIDLLARIYMIRT